MFFILVEFITKCEGSYYKVRQLILLQSATACCYKVWQLFYYKVRHVLLQSASGITKCEEIITKCGRYITKCDRTRHRLPTLEGSLFGSNGFLQLRGINYALMPLLYFSRLALHRCRISRITNTNLDPCMTCELSLKILPAKIAPAKFAQFLRILSPAKLKKCRA